MKRLILILFLILSIGFTFAATPTKTCYKDKKTKKTICKIIKTTAKINIPNKTLVKTNNIVLAPKIDIDLEKSKLVVSNINLYISKFGDILDSSKLDTLTGYRSARTNYYDTSNEALSYYSQNSGIDTKYNLKLGELLHKAIINYNNKLGKFGILLYSDGTGNKSIGSGLLNLININYNLSQGYLSIIDDDCLYYYAQGLSMFGLNLCNGLSNYECNSILDGHPYKGMKSYNFSIANTMSCNKYKLSINSSNSSLYTYETDSYIENISIIDGSIYDISTIYK